MIEAKKDEPGEIATFLSKIIGAKFEEDKPTSEFPPSSSDKVDWVVRCLDLVNARKAFHADAIWKEGQQVVIETRGVGSISEWLTWHYGEDALDRLHELDLSDFGNERKRNKVFDEFPRLAQRISQCESILDRTSSEHNVKLQIRYEGARWTAILYFQALLRAGSLSSEIAQVERGVAALREAVEEVSKL